MTRKHAKELLPILQAYADGKTIQTIMPNGEWRDCENPDFNCNISFYRIKPEENYIIEQNCGENRIEGGVVGISGSVNPLYDQLQSYESYINDIPLVIDPCKQCAVYKRKGDYDTGHFDSDGQWDDSNSCKMCCWYYDSKFEVEV